MSDQAFGFFIYGTNFLHCHCRNHYHYVYYLLRANRELVLELEENT